jgi:hypothetical protein
MVWAITMTVRVLTTSVRGDRSVVGRIATLVWGVQSVVRVSTTRDGEIGRASVFCAIFSPQAPGSVPIKRCPGGNGKQVSATGPASRRA